MALSSIKNLDSLIHKLKNISQMEQAKETMNQAVVLVHGQAKMLAPVDKGNLAGSIHPKVINQGQKHFSVLF